MKKLGVSFAIGAGLASGFKSTMGAAGKQVNDLSSTIKGLERSQGQVDRFKGLKHGLRTTEEELRQATLESNRLGAELAATAKPTKKLQQEAQAAASKTKKLKTALSSQKQELQKLRTGLEGAGVSTANLRRDNDHLTASLNRAKKAQQGLTRVTKAQQANQGRRDNLQGKLLGAAATGAAVALPVKMAMDFESAMADVKKVVNFDSPQAFKQMGQDIMAMTTSGGIPMAAEGIASIVAAAGQAGIAKGSKELLAFAADAAKMGVAFDLAAEDSGKMLADWRSGMALNQGQAIDLANAVNYLSNNMNAQAGALGEVLQSQGAVAMSAGLTEIQTASLAAALLSGGSGPEKAATALKNLTGALTKGKAATSAQSAAFAELGMDAEEMAVSMQDDAPAAIREVFKALSEAPKSEQNALVSQLFGEESKGAIMPLLANLKNLDQAFTLTANKAGYAGSMEAEFAERSKTAANELQLLRNQTSRLGVNIGTVLLPPLVGLAKIIGPIIGGVAALTTKFPRTSATVIGLSAGVAGLTVATIGLGYAFTFVQGGLLNVQKVWALMNARMALAKVGTIGLAVAQRASAAGTAAWTAAQWLLNVALFNNPIGLVVAGAAALIGIGVLLYKKWEPFRVFIDGLWTKFKDIAAFVGKIAGFTPAGLAFKAGKAIMGGDKEQGVAAAPAASGVMAAVGQPPRSVISTPPTASRTSAAASSGAGVTITQNITLNMQGGDPKAARGQFDQALQMSEARIKEIVERIMGGDRRLSYAS